MRARIGESILRLWTESGARSLFVVGTGKNVGKTVAMRAIYGACMQEGITCALTSIGRDGEAADIGDAAPKPRLWLEPATVIATAASVLPHSPASELLALTPYQTAAGPLVYARVRDGAFYELIGPPHASNLRRVVRDLCALAPRTLVDGAVDRIAALAGGEDAIVVSCGAGAARTMSEAIDGVRALIVRLRTTRFNGGEARRIEGALTPAIVAQLLREGETRAVVVRDPTQIALGGKAALHAFDRLTIRCERPLKVIAVTVASIGADGAFEPRSFAHDVARATGLPVFDVYAAEYAA